MIYCLSCKKRTPDNNLTAKITKNKKPYVQSKCSVCKKLKSQFVSIKQIKVTVFYLNYLKIYQYLIKYFKDKIYHLHFFQRIYIFHIFHQNLLHLLKNYF